MKLQKILLLVIAVALLAFFAISCDFSDSTNSAGSGNSNSVSESVSDSNGGSTESGTTPAACEHEFADDFTCHDRMCLLCNEVVKATTAHTLADDYTCHDRECSVCSEVVKATTAHTFADDYTCHDRECTVCEEVVKATTAHTFADDYTCHDRECSVCSEVVKATTEHTYGDWTVVDEATCLVNGEDERVCGCGAKETRTTVGKHDFDDSGVCSVCSGTVKTLLMKSVDSAEIKVEAGKGVYSVLTTKTEDPKESYDAVTVISGEVLKTLKDLGYTTLTFNVKNPVSTITGDTWKQFRIAADKRENLDDAPIKSYGATDIWNGANHTVSFTIELETYAGRDLYIFVDKCKTVPTEIQITEFYDKELPEFRLEGSDNGSVKYIEGKGWHVYANDGATAFYYGISAEILKYYIDKGYTSLKISFTNTFNLDGIVTAGNSVNCQAWFLPKKAANSSEDWEYKAGFISQLTRDDETDSYYWVIDLTDETYDFTKGMRFYNKYADVGNAAVGHTYINAIEFTK